MSFLKRSLIGLALATAMVAAAPVQAQSVDLVDESPSAGAMAFDAVIVRPISFVATVIGMGVFVVALPFTTLAGTPPSEPARRLIAEPAAYTFARPLGEMR